MIATPLEKRMRRIEIYQSLMMAEIEQKAEHVLPALQAAFGDFPLDRIRGKRGQGDIVDARRALVGYLMSNGYTSMEMKRYIGFGCHTSALHLNSTHNEFMQYNQPYRSRYNKFLRLIE